MFDTIRDNFWDVMNRGGWVMWPLLGLSVLGVTLAFERFWFWLRTNNPGRVYRLGQLTAALRYGDAGRAHKLADRDRWVYARIVQRLLRDGCSSAAASDAIESQRPRLERFMPTLSTIITAAPLLGILGTVTGIIRSFRVLSDQMSATDPRAVSQGIAEALLTTAAGLTVAIVVLFPYNAFRAQIDRALGRMETLVAAAEQGQEAAKGKARPQRPPAATK